MGYHTTNAAYAYDMRAESYAPAQPAAQPRPRLDVVTGAGRETSQSVSPVFTGVVKVFCVLAALVLVIGLARVTIASVAASTLNANAQLINTLENAREQSSDLEVMRSVYGAETRIRDLAVGTLGMVEAQDGDVVVLDFTQAAPASSVAR